MASAQFSETITLRVPPEYEFDFLADPSTAPIIDPAVIDYRPDDLPMRQGVRVKIRMREFFAPEGTLESILYDDEFRVSDGTLTARVQTAMNTFDMASLEPVGPLLVDGNMVCSVSRAGPNRFSSLLVFTDTGTVRLVRHISLNS